VVAVVDGAQGVAQPALTSGAGDHEFIADGDKATPGGGSNAQSFPCARDDDVSKTVIRAVAEDVGEAGLVSLQVRDSNAGEVALRVRSDEQGASACRYGRAG